MQTSQTKFKIFEKKKQTNDSDNTFLRTLNQNFSIKKVKFTRLSIITKNQRIISQKLI